MLSVFLVKWTGAYVISLSCEVDRGICYQSSLGSGQGHMLSALLVKWTGAYFISLASPAFLVAVQ